MRKLTVFENVSLDGFFVDAHGDMSWAHKHDPEWTEWSGQNAQSGGELVFGRVTYQMMASFWPTEAARQQMPDIAEGINREPKVVFSRTLDRADWNNTRLEKGDLVEALRRLKGEPGGDLVIMGSGSIVSQAAAAGLVDSYTLVVNPVVLGRGRTLFETVRARLALELTDTRRFTNGNVVLSYRAA